MDLNNNKADRPLFNSAHIVRASILDTIGAVEITCYVDTEVGWFLLGCLLTLVDLRDMWRHPR